MLALLFVSSASTTTTTLTATASTTTPTSAMLAVTSASRNDGSRCRKRPVQESPCAVLRFWNPQTHATKSSTELQPACCRGEPPPRGARPKVYHVSMHARQRARARERERDREREREREDAARQFSLSIYICLYIYN